MLLSHKLNFIWISIFISFHYLTKLPYVKHAIIFDNLFLVLGVEFHINNLTFCYKVLQTKNVNIITNIALKMSKYIFFWSKFSLICTLINQENLCIWTFLHSVTFDFYCIVPSYMSWVFLWKGDNVFLNYKVLKSLYRDLLFFHFYCFIRIQINLQTTLHFLGRYNFLVMPSLKIVLDPFES